MGGSTSSDIGNGEEAINTTPTESSPHEKDITDIDDNIQGHYVGERVLLKGTGGRWYCKKALHRAAAE